MEELKEILFDKYDSKVNLEEYTEMVFQGFDADGNGVIDYKELLVKQIAPLCMHCIARL